MTVLFWDIDGTLLVTARAGIFAWEEAVREVVDRAIDLGSMKTAGMTDYQIAVKLLESLAVPADAPRVDELVGRYEARLPANLPKRQGRVLPGVRDILDAARVRADRVRSYLLTGNTRGGAAAKLTYYGIAEYFADGAFAEDTGDRSSIARRALDLARRGGPVDEDRLFVIGDTPHDIHCARAIGARAVAVATGPYSVDELREAGAWLAVPVLPPPAEFFTVIDGTRAAAGSAPASA